MSSNQSVIRQMVVLCDLVVSAASVNDDVTSFVRPAISRQQFGLVDPPSASDVVFTFLFGGHRLSFHLTTSRLRAILITIIAHPTY